MKKLFTLLILLIFFAGSSWAINVQIGSGTTTTVYFPIYTCYGYNYSQQIYLDSEIAAGGGSAGTISKIRFFYNSGGTNYATWPNWTVYLGNTTKTVFAGNTDWEPVANLTQVFSGNIPTPVAGTWLEITLTTPFAYSGGNLLVAIDENTPGYSCTASWYSYAAGTNRGILYYNDNINPNPASPPTANYGPNANLSQIQLDMETGACTGTPVPGNTLSSANPVCANVNFTLSLENSTPGTGVTYQWQTSPDGNDPWAIAGPNSPTWVTTQTVATYYRCQVTCEGTGTSTPIGVDMNPPTSCYCDASGGCDEHIGGVQIGTINNTSDCSVGGYADYTALSTDIMLLVGSSITVTNPNPYSPDQCGAWADWNVDGDFYDAGEAFVLTNVGGTGATFTGTITPPADALLGNTRLRIRLIYTGTLDPCGTTSYGEVEDYTLNVIEPEYGTLQGYVYNAVGGCVNPLIGATVSNGTFTTTTDNIGFYQFLSSIPAGTYDFTASLTGFISQTVTGIVVNSGSTTAQDFCLGYGLIDVDPESFEKTLPVDGTTTDQLTIYNNGTAPLTWNASIDYPERSAQFAPIHIPAFTGKLQKSHGDASIMAAPAIIPSGKSTEPLKLNSVRANNFGWIGCPATDNLYMMDMSTYGITTIGPSVVDPSSGDFPNGDFQNMYMAGTWGVDLYVVDVTTGVSTYIAPFSGGPFNVSGMATDRTSGVIYVCGTDITNSYIGTLDPATGVITQIGALITNVPGLIEIAIDGTGQMYGWCLVTDNAYTIDKITGVATLLGPLGFDANYGQGGNWNVNDNLIYLTALNNTTGLPELRVMDPATGATAYLAPLSMGQSTAIGFPGSVGWLSLGSYGGIIDPGTSAVVDVNFDATDMETGDYYGNINLNHDGQPLGTVIVPCTLHVVAAECPRPTAQLSENETTEGADLSWTDPEGTTWDLYIVPAGTPAPDTGTPPTIDNTSINPLTWSGGLPGTAYEWYVRRDCGTEVSTWRGPDAFTTLLCYPEDQCQYSMMEFDSWGDGWNGALIGLRQNGVVVATFGENFIYIIGDEFEYGPEYGNLCPDMMTEIVAVAAGSYPTEVGFTLYDVVGDPVFDHPFGTSFTTGYVFYTFQSSCELPSCLPPANLTTLNITSSSAELSFDLPPIIPESFFDVFYAENGIAPGGTEGTTLTGVMPPVLIENLEENTAYNWYAKSVCGLDQPDIEHFWVAIDGANQLVPGLNGGSTEVMEPGEDLTWYPYQDESGESWYNIWFYNDPYDADRMKIIKMGFWVQRIDPSLEGNIFYVVNWSAPGWNPDPPAFPMPENEDNVERSPTNGPIPVIAADLDNPYGQWIDLTYVIDSYNPAWVSVDIWGDNIIILDDVIEPPMTSPLYNWWQQSPLPGGILVHECLPKPSGNSSDWGGPVVFTTLPQCPEPTGLAAGNITTSSAELSWIGPPDSFFDVFFGPGSDPFTGTLLTSVNSPLFVEDLEQGADYSFSVRTDCGFDDPKVDYFWMAMEEEGILLDFPMSGGIADDLEEGEDGTWYLYNEVPDGSEWWNIWFYNDTVDINRMKKIRMGFWIKSFDNVDAGILNYVINWSDTAWDGPGFPTPLDEAFIHRSPVNGPLAIPVGPAVWVELYYIIPDYNPEWVSVDLWGENIQILQNPTEGPPSYSQLWQYWVPGSPAGIIVHECLPKNYGPTSEWSVPVSFSTLCGTFNIPYAQDFDSKISPAIPNCMTVTDDNTDGIYWFTNTYGRSLPNSMFIYYNSSLAMNDWFFTPPLALTPGTYNLSFWYRSSGTIYSEKLEVKWGTAPNAAGMTNGPVFDNNDIATAIYEEGKADLVVTTAGDYYVGWHCYSDADMYYLTVDDILIEALYIWTGLGADNEWDNTANWDRNVVPNSLSNVLIPAVPANPGVFPIILAGQTVNCGDLTVEDGAAVTVQPGGELNVLKP